MPIEFYCPGCGNLMRTPDETAGRKGRCPTCQLKVQIPASSVAATSSEFAVPRTAVAASPKGKAPEPIRFDCGSCGKTLSIATTNAGKKGKCPHCGELMSIPLKSPAAGKRWKGTPKQRSTTSPARSSTPAPTPQSAPIKAGGEKIEFPCSNCREVVRVGVAAAGKKGQCPRCQAVIKVPLKSTSVSGLQPIPSNTQTPLRPQGKSTGPTPGLTPLPPEPNSLSFPSTADLTPLPSSAPVLSGLTPLDDSGLAALEPLGLTPLGPVGSGALGDDLFGSDSLGLTQVDAGNPFRADVTPYRAPAAAPRIPVGTRKGGRRAGAEVATMVCGGCLALYAVTHMLLAVIWLFLIRTLPASTMDRLRDNAGAAAALYESTTAQIALFALTGMVMLTILAGGIQMMRLKLWGFCLTACILTVAPCSGFCVLGLPIGIWGVIMLSQGSVRSAFR